MMVYHFSSSFSPNFLLFSQMGPVFVSYTCPRLPTSLPLLILLTLSLAVELLLNLQDPPECHLSIKLFLTLSPCQSCTCPPFLEFVHLLTSLERLYLSPLFSKPGGSRTKNHNSFLSLLCHLCPTQKLVYGGNARNFPENGTKILGDTVSPGTEAKRHNV